MKYELEQIESWANEGSVTSSHVTLEMVAEIKQLRKSNEAFAITLYGTNWWIGKTDFEITKLQLFNDLLCCPFEIFHGAIERVLGHSIWTHEFGFEGTKILKAEFLRIEENKNADA